MGCVYFVGFLLSIKDEGVLLRALPLVTVSTCSAGRAVKCPGSHQGMQGMC